MVYIHVVNLEFESAKKTVVNVRVRRGTPILAVSLGKSGLATGAGLAPLNVAETHPKYHHHRNLNDGLGRERPWIVFQENN